MAYENIKCFGFHAEDIEEGSLPDVLILISRSDIYDIMQMLRLGAMNSDDYNSIRDSVRMVDTLDRVLREHKERWNKSVEDSELQMS